MNKEDIIALAHLLTSMKDAGSKMAEAIKKKDSEELAEAKNEMLSLQRQVNLML